MLLTSRARSGSVLEYVFEEAGLERDELNEEGQGCCLEGQGQKVSFWKLKRGA